MALSANQKCIIIGASHGGVSAAFALRKEGWLGSITLIDSDPCLPYHRPPLSKAYLTNSDNEQPPILKPEASYQKSDIVLKLGLMVSKIDCDNNKVNLGNGENLHYDKLVLSTGARAFIPPIHGIDQATNLFTLRTQKDVEQIRHALQQSEQKNVVIIGGGYIGLETAASIKKLGGNVTVLEREDRLLARVTSPEMSSFFEELHMNNGVTIKTSQNVEAIKSTDDKQIVTCQGGNEYSADIIIVGVGIKVNQELALQSGITVDNGITVNEHCQTSNEDIYAIGDCAFHHNKHYDRWLRLESVQNAVDQSKIAAASICEKSASYNALPWFWSDQYDCKLQIAGLSAGYSDVYLREGATAGSRSHWYYDGDQLLAVDAMNDPRNYMIGKRLIEAGKSPAPAIIADPETDMKALLKP